MDTRTFCSLALGLKGLIGTGLMHRLRISTLIHSIIHVLTTYHTCPWNTNQT